MALLQSITNFDVSDEACWRLNLSSKLSVTKADKSYNSIADRTKQSRGTAGRLRSTKKMNDKHL